MGAGGQIMRELLFSPGETNMSRQLGWRLQELPSPVSLPCCVRGWVLVNLLSVGNGRIATLKQKERTCWVEKRPSASLPASWLHCQTGIMWPLWRQDGSNNLVVSCTPKSSQIQVQRKRAPASLLAAPAKLPLPFSVSEWVRCPPLSHSL